MIKSLAKSTVVDPPDRSSFQLHYSPRHIEVSVIQVMGARASQTEKEASVLEVAMKLNIQFRNFAIKSVVFPVPPSFTLVVGGTFQAPSLNNVRLGLCGGFNRLDVAVLLRQSVFYIRQDVFDAFMFMDTHSTAALIGSPGTGKSVCVLRYAFYQDQPSRRFLLVRGVSGKVFFIWYRMAGRPQYELFEADCSYDTAFDMIRYLLEISLTYRPILLVNTLIVDGFDEKTHKAVHSMMACTTFENIRLVVCCSMQSFRNDSESQATRPMQMKRMSAWTRDEYIAGINNDCLPVLSQNERLQDEVVNSTVEKRIFYSGGNCRWFCASGDHFEKFIVQEIMKAIAVCPSLDTAILLNTPEGSPATVNSLFVTDENGCLVFSNEFVAKHMFMKVSERFITEARNMFMLNPTVQGWITELQVIRKMTLEAEFVVLTAENDVIQTWRKAATPHWFFDDTDVGVPMVDRFYFPHKWNHALFDGFFMRTRHEVHFFNITGARSHSFKHKHVVPFLRALQIHRVRFYFICRASNVDTFEIPKGGIVANGLYNIRRILFEVRAAKVGAGQLAVTDDEYPIVLELVKGKYTE